jgi:hypothetical protein
LVLARNTEFDANASALSLLHHHIGTDGREILISLNNIWNQNNSIAVMANA